MYLSDDKITEIFYLADEFCIEFEKNVSKHSIGNLPKRKPQMSQSEVITIMVLFHLGGFKNLKNFYLYHVKLHMAGLFPHTVSYNRFTELQQSAHFPWLFSWKPAVWGHVPGFLLLIRPRYVFVRTKGYQGTRSLTGLPSGENQQWAISLGLSSIMS